MRVTISRSLRTTLVFLVLLAVLPALAIIGYSSVELRERILAERSATVLRLVESLGQTMAQTTSSIERILATLAVLKPVQELRPQTAADILAGVRTRNPLLSNTMLFELNGRMVASATPTNPVDAADMLHVRAALASKRFSSGTYRVSQATGEPILPFAYLIQDDAGKPLGILTAGLRVSSFASLFEKLDLPPGAIFSVLDRQGVRLFRHPQADTATPVGRSLTAIDAWKGASLPDDLGTYEGHSPDRTPRLYAYSKLRLEGESQPYMYLVVSAPSSLMAREALNAMRRNMMYLAGAAMLAMAVAWMVGEYLLVRPLRQVAETADRIGRGDFAARTGLPRSIAETGALARAVDRMAHTLSLRQLERDRAEAALRQSEKRFRQIADSMADWIWETDARGCYTYCSSRVYDVLGYTGEEMVGRTFLYLMTGEGYEMTAMELRSLHERKAPIEELEVSRQTKLGGQARTMVSGVPVLDDAGVLLGYRGIERDISRRKVLEDQLESMALTDALTGLPNRNLIVERLRQAQARARRLEDYSYALLYVDLDRFKTINDSLGHLAGDKVLRQTAARMVESVRELDTVARYGADEFVILLEEIPNARMVARVVRRIMETMAAPLAGTDGREARLSVSIGMLLNPSSADTPENLIRKADIAMNRAKIRGGGRFQVYTPKMLVEAERRLRLEQNIDAALAEDQLYLHYQPIVDLGTGRFVGAEVLVRWNHPERGLVMPSEFIPLAEQSGRIAALERWVMHRACRDMADWRLRHPGLPNPCISINLSVKHLESQHLVADVTQCLQSYGIEPRLLVLEITETSLLHNDLGVLAKLDTLRDMGVRLAMDDFGTGYSSLAYLQRLPLDEMKIDLQFVRHIVASQENRAIVRTIVALAGGLGLATLAEGVETPEQRDVLLALGCQLGQGYLFSRPISAEAFAAQWFAQHSAPRPGAAARERDVA